MSNAGAILATAPISLGVMMWFPTLSLKNQERGCRELSLTIMRSAQNRRAGAILALQLILMAAPAHAASGKISASHAQLLKLVEQSSARYIATSRDIWEHPELG